MWQKSSLARLLSQWDEAVEDIERGYICCKLDYFADLDVRWTLRDAVAGLGARERHWLMPRLKPIDQRFTRATRPVSRRRRGRKRLPWFVRVPARGMMRAHDPDADPRVPRKWLPRPLLWPSELEARGSETHKE